jgi:hypothetical protein
MSPAAVDAHDRAAVVADEALLRRYITAWEW